MRVNLLPLAIKLKAVIKHSAGDMVDDKRVTVDQLYDALLADYKINQKSHWWAELNWNKHLKPFFGGMLARNVGTDTHSRYIEARRAEKAANGSIHSEASLLQRAFMLGYESQPHKVALLLRFQRPGSQSPAKASLSKMKVSRHKTRNIFDRYNITFERGEANRAFSNLRSFAHSCSLLGYR